jgi:hypothetical protein
MWPTSGTMSSVYSVSTQVVSNMCGETVWVTSRRPGTRVVSTPSCMHPHKERSSRAISGEHGGQQTDPSSPIQPFGKVSLKDSRTWELKYGASYCDVYGSAPIRYVGLHGFFQQVKVHVFCLYEVKANSNLDLHYVTPDAQFRAISDQLSVVVKVFRGSEKYFVLTGEMQPHHKTSWPEGSSDPRRADEACQKRSSVMWLAVRLQLLDNLHSGSKQVQPIV